MKWFKLPAAQYIDGEKVDSKLKVYVVIKGSTNLCQL